MVVVRRRRVKTGGKLKRPCVGVQPILAAAHVKTVGFQVDQFSSSKLGRSPSSPYSDSRVTVRMGRGVLHGYVVLIREIVWDAAGAVLMRLICRY